MTSPGKRWRAGGRTPSCTAAENDRWSESASQSSDAWKYLNSLRPSVQRLNVHLNAPCSPQPLFWDGMRHLTSHDERRRSSNPPEQRRAAQHSAVGLFYGTQSCVDDPWPSMGPTGRPSDQESVHPPDLPDKRNEKATDVPSDVEKVLKRGLGPCPGFSFFLFGNSAEQSSFPHGYFRY